MKGTLFSADFIKDSTGSLRLIELNTDTGIVKNRISSIDLSEFINVLSSNSITSLDIVYKPFIQSEIVSHIVEQINTFAPFITSVTLHDEDRNSIYPTTVTDASDKFILRLAYDEAAIFDSVYAKSTLNIFSLFYDADEKSKVVAFYHSSSLGEKNSLEYELNEGVIPDVAVKDINELFNPIDLYKIGSEVEGESTQDRWTNFISLIDSEDKLIQQYHHHSSSIDESNKLTTYRQVSIVYGPSLDLIHLTGYRTPSTLTLPESLEGEINTGTYVNKLADHHYYEFTTSFPSKGSAGVLSTHEVEMYPSGSKILDVIEIGEYVKSYYISGSPDLETNLTVSNWSFSGSNIPSGSYLTSASVVFIEKDDPKYRGMIELSVDGDSIFSGINKQYLVHNTSTNTSGFKVALNINPDTDYLFDIDGTLVDIDEANLFITTDTGSKFVELDVEDADTYLISGSTAFNSVVSHNAPCFVAGTKIETEEGSKYIENIEIGDKVQTFNFLTGEVESHDVLGLGQKKVNKTVVYKFKDGTILEATIDHPLYSPKHGWVSKDPDYTQSVYRLSTTLAFIGCEIFKVDGTVSAITGIEVKSTPAVVYNLRSVDVNHNFYANGFLVHNRFIGCFIAGTKINTAEDRVEVIENLKQDDTVLTYNSETGELEDGIVGEVRSHEVNSVIRLTLDNENIIVTTSEHPFYVVGKGWVEASKLESLDTCLKVNGEEATVSTVEILEEKHTVYNLINVASNHNFFANGILVHNKL